MASVTVEKHGPGWRCRWRVGPPPHQKTFLYKPDANEYRTKKLREIQRLESGLDQPTAPDITLGKFAQEYLEYSKKEKSVRTHDNFDAPGVNNLVSFLGEERNLRSVSPADVQRWKHSLKDGTTASMNFRVVSTFFNYAVKMKRLGESPAKGLSRPEEGPGGRALTDDEIKTLLENAPEPLYSTAIFSLNTMLRLEEVLLFDWAWVREVHGGLMGRIPWELRKTRKKIRKDCIFPINQSALSVMQNKRKSGKVFQVSRFTIQDQIIRLRKKLNLSDEITFHCFRHTGATRYLRNGHMEDLLGTRLWSDPRSLMRYIHVENKTLISRFSENNFQIFPPLGPHKQKRPAPGGTDLS